MKSRDVVWASRLVASEMYDGGEHRIILEMEGIAAGMYLCSVKAGGVEKVARIVVVR